MPLINITLPDQMKSFMDERHYDPNEIDSLSLPPNTNNEYTYYVDGTNGNDSYDGLAATLESGSRGPKKTIQAAINLSYNRRGIRILIRTGYYREGIDWNPWNPAAQGNVGENYYNSIGPYGDGEVVIDTSHTSSMGLTTSNAFSIFTGSIYRATITNGESVFYCVMDWNMRICREAIGYTGTDNRGTNNRTTSMTDTSKNFGTTQTWNDGLRGGTVDNNFVGAIIWNITDGSYGTVTSVSTTTNPNDTLNFSGGLTGGTDNDFDNGDQYAVYIMDVDGKFVQIGNTFYIKSTSGNPYNRKFIANPADQYSTSSGISVTAALSYVYFYGLTIVGAPGIGIFADASVKVKFEKCRIIFAGRAGLQSNAPTCIVSKCMFMCNVMLNWPRGNTYWGGGGWPNGIGAFDISASITGCISFDNGGEGNPGAFTVNDNIFMDNFSVLLYQPNQRTGQLKYSMRNTIIFSRYQESDMRNPLYLQGYYGAVSRTFVKMHPMGISTGQEGAHTDDVDNWLIANNLIIGVWAPINFYIEDATTPVHDINIINNTIIMMSELTSTPTYPELGLYPCVGIQASNAFSGATNINIKNNIIIGSNNEDNNHLLININGTQYSNMQVDYNLYCFPGNEKFYNNFTPYTFLQWKTLTGYDSHSTVTTTPGLVATDFSDCSTIYKKHLYLLYTSLAVDTGVDLSTHVPDDFNTQSRPYNLVWDKGAIEYRPTAKDYTKEALTSLPTGVVNLSTDFLPIEYDYVRYLDNRLVTITASNKYGIFLFKDISYDPQGHPPISMKWTGKTNIPGSTATIYLQIYNYTTTTWETMASNNTVAANTQFSMTGVINNNLLNYYDANKIAACRVYQQAS